MASGGDNGKILLVTVRHVVFEPAEDDNRLATNAIYILYSLVFFIDFFSKIFVVTHFERTNKMGDCPQDYSEVGAAGFSYTFLDRSSVQLARRPAPQGLDERDKLLYHHVRPTLYFRATFG